MKSRSVVEKIELSTPHEVAPPAARTRGLTSVESLPRLTAVPAGPPDEVSWRSGLRDLLQRIQRRAVPLAIVVLLHGVLLGVVLMNRRYEAPIEPAKPIQVTMIDEAVDRPEPAPMPDVKLEPLPIAVVPPMDVQIDVEPGPSAITMAAQPTSVASTAAPDPAPPVAPPRFDADYLSNPAPVYPAISRRSREEGTVTLRVRVTQGGTAAEVRIEHSSGSQRLDSAAVAAVQRWRFVPARRGTEAVEAWVLVPIEFELKRLS